MSFNKLPNDIIRLISEYIDTKNISFYSTCKELRKHQIFLHLHKIINWRYIKDSFFRENIDNRKLKIVLNLSEYYELNDVSMLGNVYDLNLSECYNITDVSMLGKVYDLNLSKCIEITDVSMLGNVHNLNLSEC